ADEDGLDELLVGMQGKHRTQLPARNPRGAEFGLKASEAFRGVHPVVLALRTGGARGGGLGFEVRTGYESKHRRLLFVRVMAGTARARWSWPLDKVKDLSTTSGGPRIMAPPRAPDGPPRSAGARARLRESVRTACSPRAPRSAARSDTRPA